jgi:tetratricopeptide (TPR) repeat protein
VTTALVGLVLTGAVSCSRLHAVGDGGSDAAAALVLRTPPTTPPAIAIHNLDAEVADQEKRMARGEPSAGFDLVARYLSRAQFEGRVDDLVRADETSASLLASRPGEIRVHLTRASVLSSIHAFAAAFGELDAVAPHDAGETMAVSQERGALLLATGREDEAAQVLKLRNGGHADEFVMRAGVEAKLGHAEEAERLFSLARTQYHDVSPIMWTWMDFERSRALEAAGNRRDAKVYLEEAVKILPSYAHAVVHLAALAAARSWLYPGVASAGEDQRRSRRPRRRRPTPCDARGELADAEGHGRRRARSEVRRGAGPAAAGVRRSRRVVLPGHGARSGPRASTLAHAERRQPAHRRGRRAVAHGRAGRRIEATPRAPRPRKAQALTARDDRSCATGRRPPRTRSCP